MASNKRLATLVGCNYPNTRNELHGCINDVRAMHHLLTTRFAFNPSDITILTDDNSSLLPTGANILQTLTHMADQSSPGDVLFFHYSGHGTLIPHHHGRHSKPEEAIVPCDFNLITDVDFRRLVDRLPAGVSFTIVSDSCHSGGLIDKEKEQIGPSGSITTTTTTAHRRRRTRTIPYQSVLEHLSSLSGIESGHVGDHLVELFGEHASAKYSSKEIGKPVAPDAGILLSGCGTDETSADMSPEAEEDGDGAVVTAAYGAFSNSIQMVMKEVMKGRVISNRELVMRAREVLREQGFTQHPCLYCSDDNADQPFLLQQQQQEAVKRKRRPYSRA